MRRNCIWQLVIDRRKKIWPSTAVLVMAGMPPRMARRYQEIREDMTDGLRDRLEKAKN